MEIKRLSKVGLLVSIIVGLLCLELILQASSFFLAPKIKNPSSSIDGDFDILCIGDSFTYGMGVATSDSYPEQLKRILNKDYPSKHINVINLGVSGYNSSQCIKYLKEQAHFYKPKIVIILAGMNNCWNFLESSYFRINKFRKSQPLRYRAKLIDTFLSKLKTYKLIKIAVLNLRPKLKLPQPLPKDDYLPAVEFLKPQRSNKLQALLDQGLKYYVAGEYELAEICYRAALELAPEDYEPHWYMGRFYIFKGKKEKAREELILAAKYAWHFHSVCCIFADLQDRQQSKNSKDFREFANLVKELRGIWVTKFSEEYVTRFIDPIISYKDNVLEEVLFYDLEELKNYLNQNQVKLVILTYPFSATKFRYPTDIYSRVANYLDVPLVNNVFIFDEHLLISRREELFSTDGHCTSKGYGLIARNVYDILKQYNLLPMN